MLFASYIDGCGVSKVSRKMETSGVFMLEDVDADTVVTLDKVGM